MIEPTRISIIMINRDGGEYLRNALQSLSMAIQVAVRANPSDYNRLEVIVVDNGSTDDSPVVVDQELMDLPCAWKLVHESQPGVNFARLTGLAEASGEYLIFVDNDLRFDSQWLIGYKQAFEKYPNELVYGGRVLIGDVEGEVPNWLDLQGDWSRPAVVVRCDNGADKVLEKLSNSEIEGPVGPNMAFNRAVFSRFGSFDPRYGLRPGSLIAGAEAEYFHRLAAFDVNFLYVADACVYHPLKAAQIKKSYFRRRLKGVGRVLARLQNSNGCRSHRIAGVKRYLIRQLASAYTQYAASCLTDGAKARFYKRCNIDILWGQVLEDLEYRKQRLDRTNCDSNSSRKASVQQLVQ